MFKAFTAYSLIFMIAVNGLLSAVGGASLCLPSSGEGHVSVGSNPLATDTCHSSETGCQSEEDATDKQDLEPASAHLDSTPSCVDFIASPSNESIQRANDLPSIKEPLITSLYYPQLVPQAAVSFTAETTFPARAPPLPAATLEQCVRKTVLRV